MAETNTTNIGELVRKNETAYISGEGTLTSKYVVSDLYEDINTIYAYLESKHVSGETDSQGREKPFFNISIAARNIWFRATDIDRKNIKIKPTKGADTLGAFVATQLLQDWMRKENFGTFLNDWGLELAGFNSAVVKFVEVDGELKRMVVPWSRLIVDPINFDDNVKIEVLELFEAQLYQHKGYDKDMVEKLCNALESRKTLDGQNKDSRNDYVKLYEVHGNLPLSYLTGKDSDDNTYVQQMHVISFVASKEKGKYDDFTLVKGRELKDPYMLTSLIPATDGSISLNGAVKNLFQAQWMVNHSQKSIKDQLDLASKLIFQTSDGNFVGQNAITAIENGDILVHAVNQPLTQLNNNSHDTVSLQNFSTTWKQLSNEINGISESMLGMNPPSGTAWRQTEALLQESHSLFEIMTENKGLAIEDMMRKFILPYLKKTLNNSKEIVAKLEAHDILKIDKLFIPKEAKKRATRKIIDSLVKGEVAEVDLQSEAAGVQADLSTEGTTRYLKPDEIDSTTWRDVTKNLEWDVEVEVTGESSDKQSILTTLNTALTVLANPNFSNNPKAGLVIDKILTETGVISPVELAALPVPSPIQPQQLPAQVGGADTGGVLQTNK